MHLLFHTEPGRKDESDKEPGRGEGKQNVFSLKKKKKISHILHILRRGSVEKAFGEPRPTTQGLCLDPDLLTKLKRLAKKGPGVSLSWT